MSGLLGRYDPRPAGAGATRSVRPGAGAILAAFAVAALAVTAGCSKSSTKADGNGSPAAGGTGCAAGATKSVDGGFCLSLPATQKAQNPYDKDDTSRRYDYTDGSGKGVTVVVTKMEDASQSMRPL
jgi:hypothetical protein